MQFGRTSRSQRIFKSIRNIGLGSAFIGLITNRKQKSRRHYVRRGRTQMLALTGIGALAYRYRESLNKWWQQQRQQSSIAQAPGLDGKIGDGDRQPSRPAVTPTRAPTHA